MNYLSNVFPPVKGEAPNNRGLITGRRRGNSPCPHVVTVKSAPARFVGVLTENSAGELSGVIGDDRLKVTLDHAATARTRAKVYRVYSYPVRHETEGGGK